MGLQRQDYELMTYDPSFAGLGMASILFDSTDQRTIYSRMENGLEPESRQIHRQTSVQSALHTTPRLMSSCGNARLRPYVECEISTISMINPRHAETSVIHNHTKATPPQLVTTSKNSSFS